MAHNCFFEMKQLYFQTSGLSRQESFDVLKCMAAFLVVVIHTGFPGALGVCGNVFSRIGVPLFFMITGYYYPSMVARGKWSAHFRKIIVLAVFAFALFFVRLYWRSFLTGDFGQVNVGFKSFILLNASPWGGHLWYFCAILYVLVILRLADRMHMRSFLYGLVPFLFLANYLLSFSGYITWYRNFLFTGLPYVLLGILFREKGDKWKLPCWSDRSLVTALVVATLLLGMEISFYWWYGLQVIRDHFLMTLPIAAGFFILALRHPSFGAGSKAALIGRKYSPYIYIFHPLFIRLRPLLIDIPLMDYAFPIIIFVLTTVFVILLFWGIRLFTPFMISCVSVVSIFQNKEKRGEA